MKETLLIRVPASSPWNLTPARGRIGDARQRPDFPSRDSVSLVQQEEGAEGVSTCSGDEESRTTTGSGAPGETRTPDLLVRSQPLYPTELRAPTTSPIIQIGERFLLSSRNPRGSTARRPAPPRAPPLRGAGFRAARVRVQYRLLTRQTNLRAANCCAVGGEGPRPAHVQGPRRSRKTQEPRRTS